jgi:hypothetical protein
LFAKNPQTDRAAYRRFVAEGMDADSPWRSLKGETRLGGEEFRIRMSALVARQDTNAISNE